MSACSNPAEFPWKEQDLTDLRCIIAFVEDSMRYVYNWQPPHGGAPNVIADALRTIRKLHDHAEDELERYVCACGGSCPCHHGK